MVSLIYIENLVFEYDAVKSVINLEKHGIDFREIQQLWNGDVLVLDSKNKDENRQLVIGMIGKKHWTVIVTMRGTQRNMIRIISARRSRDEEKKLYQQI
jgi:uncharacterized DUF497 family protein